MAKQSPRRHQGTKQEAYVQRLLSERPAYTVYGGRIIDISNDGYSIKVASSGAMNGKYAVYMACDYPIIFGWERPKHMPWMHGTPVRPKPTSSWSFLNNERTPGKVVSYRLTDDGRYEYSVRMWRTNQQWIREDELDRICYTADGEEEIIIEGVAIMANTIEHHLVPVPVEVEDLEPTLEEKVDLIMDHLGITIERIPSQLVVTQKDEVVDEQVDKAA